MENEEKLLEPKEVEIDGKKFVLSKFPAFDGREIILHYAKAHILNMNDVQKQEDIVIKLMNFVAIKLEDGRQVRLSTKALINNHLPGWETLAKIEAEMMTYNCSFFQNGEGWNFLKRLETFAQNKITEMLMALSQKLSIATKQHSGNSNTDTH